MIDFRYHLVSLVSVFLALAVGVVLGAGPLQGAIEQRVITLAAEKDTLRSELTAADNDVRHREQFTQGILPTAVAGSLKDTTVALVLLPQATGAMADDATAAVEAGGGTVLSRVQVNTGWLSADSLARRRELVSAWNAAAAAVPPPASTVAGPSASATPSAQGSSGSPSPVATPSASRSASPPVSASSVAVSVDSGVSNQSAPLPALDALFAQSLVSGSVAPVGGEAPVNTTAEERLSTMADAGLIDVKSGAGRLAQTVVVVAPEVPQANPQGDPPATLPLLQAQAPDWAKLSGALDTAGRGAVVLGPPTAADTGGVLEAVRATSALAATVSTVDTGDSAMGPLTTALALAEQRRGTAGAYGFAKGAKNPVPQPSTGG